MSKKRLKNKKTPHKTVTTYDNAVERSGGLGLFRPDQRVTLFAFRVMNYGDEKITSNGTTNTANEIIAMVDLKEPVIFIGEGASIPRGVSELPAPPQLGEYALEMLLSKEEAENLIGDLAEAFIEKEFKYGRTKARLWYWRQVVGSAWPLIYKTLRWGLLASAAEWVRRHI